MSEHEPWCAWAEGGGGRPFRCDCMHSGAKAEIERLRTQCGGACRYWEGRWRDEAAANDTIKVREQSHGDFGSLADISQSLKLTLQIGSAFPKWSRVQVEAVGMICVKLARIANGNPHLEDHWLDIQGYAELVLRSLREATLRSIRSTPPSGS